MGVTCEGTTVIYTTFEEAARRLLGEEQLRLISQMPGKDPLQLIGRDEEKFVMACAVLARSAQLPKSDDLYYLQCWARRTVGKAIKKIGEDRCRQLLNCLMTGHDFERQYLPGLFLLLAQEER